MNETNIFNDFLEILIKQIYELLENNKKQYIDDYNIMISSLYVIDFVTQFNEYFDRFVPDTKDNLKKEINNIKKDIIVIYIDLIIIFASLWYHNHKYTKNTDKNIEEFLNKINTNPNTLKLFTNTKYAIFTDCTDFMQSIKNTSNNHNTKLHMKYKDNKLYKQIIKNKDIYEILFFIIIKEFYTVKDKQGVSDYDNINNMWNKLLLKNTDRKVIKVINNMNATIDINYLVKAFNLNAVTEEIYSAMINNTTSIFIHKYEHCSLNEKISFLISCGILIPIVDDILRVNHTDVSINDKGTDIRVKYILDKIERQKNYFQHMDSKIFAPYSPEERCISYNAIDELQILHKVINDKGIITSNKNDKYYKDLFELHYNNYINFNNITPNYHSYPVSINQTVLVVRHVSFINKKITTIEYKTNYGHEDINAIGFVVTNRLSDIYRNKHRIEECKLVMSNIEDELKKIFSVKHSFYFNVPYTRLSIIIDQIYKAFFANYYKKICLHIKEDYLSNNFKKISRYLSSSKVQQLIQQSIKMSNKYHQKKTSQFINKKYKNLPLIKVGNCDKTNNIKKKKVNLITDNNNVVCQHVIDQQKLANYKNYSEKIQEFHDKWLIQNNDINVCKSCGTIVLFQNVASVSNLQFSSAEKNTNDVIIKNLYKTVDFVQKRVNSLGKLFKIHHWYGTTKDFITIQKNISYKIIVLIQTHTKTIGEYLIFDKSDVKKTPITNPMQYNIKESEQILFRFQLDNNIFLKMTSQRIPDLKRHLKINNILCYSIFVLLLEQTEHNILSMITKATSANYKSFMTNVKPYMDKLKIHVNNKNETTTLNHYPVLSYCIFTYATVMIHKNKHKNSFWQEPEKDLESPEIARSTKSDDAKRLILCINTTLYIINTILCVTFHNNVTKKNIIYKKHSTDFFNKLHLVFNNDKLFKRIQEQNEILISNTVVSSIVVNIKKYNLNYFSIPFLRKHIWLPFAYIPKSNSLPVDNTKIRKTTSFTYPENNIDNLLLKGTASKIIHNNADLTIIQNKIPNISSDSIINLLNQLYRDTNSNVLTSRYIWKYNQEGEEIYPEVYNIEDVKSIIYDSHFKDEVLIIERDQIKLYFHKKYLYFLGYKIKNNITNYTNSLLYISFVPDIKDFIQYIGFDYEGRVNIFDKLYERIMPRCFMSTTFEIKDFICSKKWFTKNVNNKLDYNNYLITIIREEFYNIIRNIYISRMHRLKCIINKFYTYLSRIHYNYDNNIISENDNNIAIVQSKLKMLNFVKDNYTSLKLSEQISVNDSLVIIDDIEFFINKLVIKNEHKNNRYNYSLTLATNDLIKFAKDNNTVDNQYVQAFYTMINQLFNNNKDIPKINLQKILDVLYYIVLEQQTVKKTIATDLFMMKVDDYSFIDDDKLYIDKFDEDHDEENVITDELDYESNRIDDNNDIQQEYDYTDDITKIKKKLYAQ